MQRYVIFLSVVLSVWAGVHVLVLYRLQPLGLSAFWLGLGLAVMACLFPLAHFAGYRWEGTWTLWLARTANFWMGLVFLLFSVLLALWLAGLLWRGLEALPWQLPPWPLKPLTWMAVALCLALAAYGTWMAALPWKINRFELDRSAEYSMGKSRRIVQLSDVHLGLELGERWLGALVERVNSLEPDLILITGDLVDAEMHHVKPLVPVLRKLRAGEAVFATTGNHEYYAGLQEYLAFMQEAGIPVLQNQLRVLEDGFQVVGTNDHQADGFPGEPRDVKKAFAQYDSSSPGVYMCHQPKGLEHAVQKGVDLILSGHTHGGQIYPFHLLVKIPFEYLRGRYSLSPGTDLIVTTGTGYWGPPMRIGSRCEIVVVEMRY